MNAVISNVDPRGFFHALKGRERYFQVFALKISDNVEKHYIFLWIKYFAHKGTYFWRFCGVYDQITPINAPNFKKWGILLVRYWEPHI